MWFHEESLNHKRDSCRPRKFTHVVILVNHFLRRGGCLVTTNRALMNVEIDFEDLEASQQIDERHGQDSGENHSECDHQHPARIRFRHDLALFRRGGGRRRGKMSTNATTGTKLLVLTALASQALYSGDDDTIDQTEATSSTDIMVGPM
jgi:hypothetical protein